MPNRDQMKEVYTQIGQQLKDTRLKRGLTLEKISNKTKISIQNLDNIESGRGYLIAGEFYLRSFIKSYSKALRINEKKFLLALDNSLKKESEQKIGYEKKEHVQEKNKITNEKIPTAALVFVASIGLIIIFLFNIVNRDTELGETLSDIKPKQDLQISKIDENIENINISRETNIKKTNINIDELENYKIKENNLFLKQIIAKEDVWIEIKDLDENILVSTILMKDESFNIPIRKENITISTSNAGALFLMNESNKNHIELGSFGTILDSVDLNSLISKH